jgi:hypothetical protein
MTDETTKRIRELNDHVRQRITSPWLIPSGVPAKIFKTQGVDALPIEDQLTILAAIREFDDFTEDNDPHGEHDFGSLDHHGQKIFWKIDYYAPDMMHGSENPADPSQTVRVLTIMLAEEY